MRRHFMDIICQLNALPLLQKRVVKLLKKNKKEKKNLTARQDRDHLHDGAQHSRVLFPSQDLWLPWNTFWSQSCIFPAAQEGDHNVDEPHKYILLHPKATEVESLYRCTLF